MKDFNMKQWLMESKSGMYSKTILNEHRLEDATILGSEIAKAHPELIRYRHDGETKKYQDAIFKYAGEALQNAGVSLATVRGLSNDHDWAMELVSAVGDELEHGGDEEKPEDIPGFGGTRDALSKLSVREINPAALGAPQAAADAKMQQQDDENGDMVDNVSMGLEEEPNEQIGIAHAEKVHPAESGIDQYLDKLHKHDWFYMFSDDRRAWDAGSAEKAELRALYSKLNDVEKQKALDAYTQEFQRVYRSDQFPQASKNLKYLTTTSFNGFV